MPLQNSLLEKLAKMKDVFGDKEMASTSSGLWTARKKGTLSSCASRTPTLPTSAVRLSGMRPRPRPRAHHEGVHRLRH